MKGKLRKRVWRTIEVSSVCVASGVIAQPYITSLDPTILSWALWVSIWLTAWLAMTIFDRL